MKRYLVVVALFVALFVAGGMDHDAQVLEAASDCTEDEVLVEVLAGYLPADTEGPSLVNRVWLCAHIEGVRPLDR